VRRAAVSWASNPFTPSSIEVLLRDNMGAIRLLLTTTSIAELTYGGISSIIHHKVTHSSITRLTMQSSTPNEKTESEVAKQALSDYIASIRPTMVSYCHDPELTVIDNHTCMKVSVNSVSMWRGLVWDKSIYKYSVKIDRFKGNNIQMEFAPTKLYDLNSRYYGSSGRYLSLCYGRL
jgi:hypothetical protein